MAPGHPGFGYSSPQKLFLASHSCPAVSPYHTFQQQGKKYPCSLGRNTQHVQFKEEFYFGSRFQGVPSMESWFQDEMAQ